MNVRFRKVRWKNLMSYGNEFAEIDFEATKTTLIVGKNGSGKSTFMDALFWCLWKKPFRKISIPQMLNSINRKDGIAEVEFDIGSKQYLVRRGLNPDIFEIWVNGEMLKKPAGALDYQETLDNILKITHRAARQILALGTNFVPFMELTAAQRREIIENLLDIQIFTLMNTLLKTRVDETSRSLEDTNRQISIDDNKVKLYKKHVDELKQNNKSLIKDKNAKIGELRAAIDAQIGTMGKLNDCLAELELEVADSEKVKAKVAEIKRIDQTLKAKLAKIKTDMEFYSDNDSCPTCQQEIDAEFKKTTIDTKTKTIQEIDAALTKLSDTYENLSKRVLEIQEVNGKISTLNHQISKVNNEIFTYNKLIDANEVEIVKLKQNTEHIDLNLEEMQQYTKNVERLKGQKAALVDDKAIQDVAAYLLKDQGIKSKFIKQYVPVINKLINKYLATMDFFVNFEIDERFNETIKSRFRDEFSYGSFSEGEKQRLDLAFLFTWRTVAKLRNSISSNLLIMDEVFDGSLDLDGTEKLLEIIKGYDPDVNIIMISHKESMLDQFDRVIRVEKIKNFSQFPNSA